MFGSDLEALTDDWENTSLLQMIWCQSFCLLSCAPRYLVIVHKSVTFSCLSTPTLHISLENTSSFLFCSIVFREIFLFLLLQSSVNVTAAAAQNCSTGLHCGKDSDLTWITQNISSQINTEKCECLFKLNLCQFSYYLIKGMNLWGHKCVLWLMGCNGYYSINKKIRTILICI